jgi:peroxiredoxin (alkyl hydroperoxide reductase subunit C)
LHYQKDKSPVTIADFTAQAVMPDNSIAELKLSAYRGKYVCLFFYPLDFTFVCPSEIIAFDKKVEAFKEKNCEVIGVSVDSAYTHLAWRNTPRHQGGLGDIGFQIFQTTGGHHNLTRIC